MAGKAQIAVIGSSNTDMVIRTSRLPKPGETLLGGSFFMNAGGKGANQAVAAARLGGKVIFIARLGNDIFGNQAKKLFVQEGIDVGCIFTDDESPSGVALINVDDLGENCIAVAPGANDRLSVDDLTRSENVIVKADIILLQLEIPLNTVEQGIKMGFNAGKKVILNPAPARTLPDRLYHMLYLITPNETEAGILTGIEVTDEDSAYAASETLCAKGVQTVIITLGSKGSYIFNGQRGKLVPAPRVKAVDTTAAGDIFNGALCVGLGEGMELEKAVEFANKAAAISVTRLGAQASAPGRGEMGEVVME
jgi:ribokinase